jgi:hypothetical protein
MEECTILILGKSGDDWYVQQPVVTEGIQWKTKRTGEPACLTFTCIKDSLLSFQEGSEVTFRYGDTKVFSGYVFEKHRNKDQHIEVTCYDRTRYFKNKENYVFTNVRADQIISRLAKDLGIRVGELANTKHVIQKFAASNMTFWDIIDKALGETAQATGELYTLYDDYGSICLKSLGEMQTDYLLDEDVAEDFDYTTSIDQNTYNYIVVKVKSKDKDGNETITPIYEKDEDSIKKYGVLIYDTESTTVEYAKQKAKALLKMRKEPTCSLGVNGAFGDINVRAGSTIFFSLNLGDDHLKANKAMLVDEVTHTFDNGEHYMDLTLKDGGKAYE